MEWMKAKRLLTTLRVFLPWTPCLTWKGLRNDWRQATKPLSQAISQVRTYHLRSPFKHTASALYPLTGDTVASRGLSGNLFNSASLLGTGDSRHHRRSVSASQNGQTDGQKAIFDTQISRDASRGRAHVRTVMEPTILREWLLIIDSWHWVRRCEIRGYRHNSELDRQTNKETDVATHRDPYTRTSDP